MEMGDATITAFLLRELYEGNVSAAQGYAALTGGVLHRRFPDWAPPDFWRRRLRLHCGGPFDGNCQSNGRLAAAQPQTTRSSPKSPVVRIFFGRSPRTASKGHSGARLPGLTKGLQLRHRKTGGILELGCINHCCSALFSDLVTQCLTVGFMVSRLCIVLCQKPGVLVH